ncbi:TRAP transporter substrate-binding protein [Alkalihalobacterium alkalinitrilicum]|uniref:TRAP transporter substrate-binding protein n=1 Tax=Alkalihalobacterium alkalinitrilicum TaxID=427920 RepID=UPI0009956915|nr:TRAP transporter substrate-binding protein [Alkalihalobacterium alkalinitrilicum]
MKRLFVGSITLAMSLMFAVGCSSSDTSSGGNEETANNDTTPTEEVDATVLKLGHVWPNSEIHAQGVEQFKEEVEELTDGRIVIEVYENGSLGDDRELLEGLNIGTADIWVGGAGVLSGSSETAQIFTVPFMFHDQAHFDNVYNGEVGEEISSRINAETGNQVLSYWTRGARMLTVNEEVNTPEDLNGLRIRVPDSPVFVESWKMLGAAPTPMAFGEVFTSLQQGVIDGQENPLSLIYNSKFNEVVDYLVLTEHVREPIAMVISGSKFEALDPELQELLLQAANGQGKDYVANEVLSGEEGYLEALEEAGMEVIRPDLSLFQEKLGGFVEQQFPAVTEIHEMILSAK